MNFKKLTSGAETMFNRAKQYTEEKLGQAEKTEYDANFQNLLDSSDKIKLWTEKLIKLTEAMLQPNPSARMENLMYSKLQADNKPLKQEESEQLGLAMVEAGNDLGPTTSYGTGLVKCGEGQQKLAEAWRIFAQATISSFLTPLKSFLDGEMTTLQKERKTLETKRLDLDVAKSKYKRATTQGKEADQETITKVESELGAAQGEFDRQLEVTKLLLEALTNSHGDHARCLSEFMAGQVAYYKKCHEIMSEMA